MATRFYHSYQFRIFFFLFIFLGIAFLAIALLGKNFLVEVSEKERGKYLTSFTRVLDAEIPPGGYQEILKNLHLEDASREEQIQGLDTYLRPISDYVSTLTPGLGVGFYSNELDAILTYSPSATYKHLVGVRINEEHPGRIVMNTNTLMVNKGAMVRGEILNAMLPLERQGKVIGYIWANQLSQKLDEEFAARATQIGFFLGLCFLGISLLLALLAGLFFNDVGKLVNGVENIRNGVTNRIPHITGKLGDVAQSINTLTEEVARAQTDSARATLTLQNILDNIDAGIFIYDTKKKEIVYANKYTQTKLGLAGILGETFAQTFYNANDFSLCPCFNAQQEPNFNIHRREFYIETIQKNVHITERLITWHDGRVLLMLIVSYTPPSVRDEDTDF